MALEKTLATFALAAGTALTTGCVTTGPTNKMVEPMRPVATDASHTPTQADVVSAPSRVDDDRLHPRLAEALQRQASEYKDRRGNPAPFTINTKNCLSQVLAGETVPRPLNANDQNGVQQRTNREIYGRAQGAANKIGGPLGIIIQGSVQNSRNTNSVEQSSYQRLCGMIGTANVAFSKASSEREYKIAEQVHVQPIIRNAAATEHVTNSMTERTQQGFPAKIIKDITKGHRSPLEGFGR